MSELTANRAIAAAVLTASAGVLGLAMWLSPASDGLGTHRQLGLPACGFYAGSGLPCATCGMTTAFSHAVRGQVWMSFMIQPAGAALAVLTACALIVSLWALISGMSLTPIAQWIWSPRFVIAMSGLVVLAWGYKAAALTGWI